MCGILGYTSIQKHIDKTNFVLALDTLQHRGPETSGTFINEKNTVLFGHRRLKIIDLSEASAQPYFSNCGRYVITYNGEIYNYKTIAKNLDLQLKTTGDTEVIIEAFAKIGTKSFEMLNGIFAFAIYDLQTQKIFLCRDRIGIKPLFYYYDGVQFAFASEIKAIKKLIDTKLEINKNAFAEFLHLGFVYQPDTVYKNVYKFPSGNFLELDINKTINTNQFNFIEYWNLYKNIEKETHKNEAEVEKKLEELLFNSVESQMISDVPLGTFLSGGIDSSLVTTIASKIKIEKIKTFSIGYENQKYNEAKFAEQIAQKIGTEHYSYLMKEHDIEEILHQIITAFDEPFADSSAFPTMIVSMLAKQQVTVTLSGDGGDELFMGYGMHQWAERLENPILKNLKNPIQKIVKNFDLRFKKASWLLDYKNYNHLRTHIFSQEQHLFSEKELDKYLIENTLDLSQINASYPSKRTLTAKEKQSFWDINYYLRGDIMVKVDRATMQYSLESRVPLLDNNIVDYAINIDESLKYKNGETKYILKKILYKYLPKEMFNRPKWGFAMPLEHWLQTNLKFLIDKYLAPIIINKYDIVANLYVEELIHKFLNGEGYLYAKIWNLILVHWWLEENN